MASVSHARGFDETEFNTVLENCLRDFPQVKVLRKEQKACLLNLARGKDVFAILPTGFGKSLIFQLFPRVSSALCSSEVKPLSTIIVVFSVGFSDERSGRAVKTTRVLGRSNRNWRRMYNKCFSSRKQETTMISFERRGSVRHSYP